VSYIPFSQSIFYCDACCGSDNPSKLRLRAKILPKTECDTFIDNFLKRQNLNKDDSLTIRMLSSMKKNLKVKRIIQDFRVGPSDITYNNCALFTFFDSGQDVDICFFSVFFHLYGSDCPEPNKNVAYISYIDSVNLYPSSDRTLIYRTILLGLFEFLKTKNYSKIFLWSCPPKPNQDYIFYRKPASMKLPTKTRLSNWYIELFKLGKQIGVIDSFQGVNDYATTENWTSISDIPYLEDDMWITRAEEAIRATNKDVKKKQEQLMKVQMKHMGAVSSGTMTKKKLEASKAQLDKKLQEAQSMDKTMTIWKMMNVQIRGFSTEYFILKMSTEDAEGAEDPVGVEMIEREWIDGRSSLVDFLWEFALEFSTERRAIYSTIMFLYRICVEGSICRSCGKVAVEGVTVSERSFEL
jgi:hypothetical protein